MKKQKKTLFTIVTLILFFVISIFLFNIIKSNMFPLKYILIGAIILVSIVLLNILLLLKFNNIISKILSITFSIIIVIGLIIGILLTSKTNNFISKLKDKGYQIETYSLIVLKSSSEKIEDYNNKKIGFLNPTTENKEKIIQELNKLIIADVEDYSILGTICIDLLDNKIEAVLLERSYIEILEEVESDFLNEVKIIWTKEIKVPVNDIAKKSNTTEEPFIVVISGVDVFGSISKVARSDVNIIAVINPKTYKILLVHIPRDYYVEIDGINARDKLTSSGALGINSTVKSIEKYFDLEVNYYMKVNFSSLVKVVDVIGGIDVYSEHSFLAKKTAYIKKGVNHLNGDQSLAFTRERLALPRGDRDRGVNQQKVLTAIIEKMMSPKLLMQFTDILDVLSDSFITNIEEAEIKRFINFELDRLPSWKIESISVDGNDLWIYNAPFNYGHLSYVMEPNIETVNKAKEKISEYLK